jgi:excisionase family DNA binding protein
MTAPNLNSKALRHAAKIRQTLTTAEAANLTGYSADHISLLLRRGVLHGQRRGRDWFLRARKLLNYVEKKPHPGRKTR